MSKETNSESSALVVLGTAEMLPRVTLSKLQTVAVEQFGVISRSETETPLRAILLGIALHRIKAGMPGEFSRWIQNEFTAKSCWTAATAKKNSSFYMRLAVETIEQTSATKPELQALPENGTNLAEIDGSARRFMSRVEKFVDGRSLNQLLHDLGIKDGAKLGGARTAARPGGKAQAPDAEQLYLFARDEIGGVIQRAEELLLKENQLQHLVGHPEEVRGVIASLQALADRVEKAAKPLLKK